MRPGIAKGKAFDLKGRISDTDFYMTQFDPLVHEHQMGPYPEGQRQVKTLFTGLLAPDRQPTGNRFDAGLLFLRFSVFTGRILIQHRVFRLGQLVRR